MQELCSTSKFAYEHFSNISNLWTVNSFLKWSRNSPRSQSFPPPPICLESPQETCIFPADTTAGPLSPQIYLHKSQESVQNVNSQNKRLSWKPKEVGQAPEIFHLGIPLSGAQGIFILWQEKQSQNWTTEDRQHSQSDLT